MATKKIKDELAKFFVDERMAVAARLLVERWRLYDIQEELRLRFGCGLGKKNLEIAKRMAGDQRARFPFAYSADRFQQSLKDGSFVAPPLKTALTATVEDMMPPPPSLAAKIAYVVEKFDDDEVEMSLSLQHDCALLTIRLART